jgi:hypothetical protein
VKGEPLFPRPIGRRRFNMVGEWKWQTEVVPLSELLFRTGEKSIAPLDPVGELRISSADEPGSSNSYGVCRKLSRAGSSASIP